MARVRYMYNSRYEILNKHSSPLDIIFLELEGIDIKCLIISSILKEILQFYNNEKSHDFNKDSLRTRLRMFVANLLGGPYLIFWKFTQENIVFLCFWIFEMLGTEGTKDTWYIWQYSPRAENDS